MIISSMNVANKFSARVKQVAFLSSVKRSCPIGYSISPTTIKQSKDINADILFVVGGLYGNIEALDAIEKRIEEEENSSLSDRPLVVFNGDFNFFNASSTDWLTINKRVMKHQATSGNVEIEAVNASSDWWGCGCAYPLYVPDEVVMRSDSIVHELRSVALSKDEEHVVVAKWMRELPKLLTVKMGDSRVGILHGDVHSISGWSFAVESMEPLDKAILHSLNCNSDTKNKDSNSSNQSIGQVTTTAEVSDWLEQSGVDCFACTHTCLPFAQTFDLLQTKGAVINNGSAGMPNFTDTPGVGLITRIAALKPGQEFNDKDIPAGSVYGTTLGNLRVDAIAVVYDHEKWVERFLKRWPQDSPAHESYYKRIISGTELSLAQAARRGFSLTK